MNKITELNKALPLVASVLGKKYGVQVQIGGDTACTDGSIIRLPTLPLEPDETLAGLLKGYTDHESAHIRETDFDVLKDKDVTPLIKNIWNIFEDWRVENRLAERFPGCRTNLHWLINHEFTKRMKKPSNPAMQILNYLLLAVRAWDVKAVEKNRDIIGAFTQQSYPDLYSKLNSLLEQVKVDCHSSKDAMRHAKNAAALIKAESLKLDKEPPKQAENDNNNSKQTGNVKRNPSKQEGIKELLKSGDDDLPGGLGEIVAEQLEGAVPRNLSMGLSMAVEAPKTLIPLDIDDYYKVRRASAALHARLHSLLQSKTLVRRSGSRHGKLDTGRLYRLNHDPKVFLRNGEKQGINTAVHILLDCSSSMRDRIGLASQACYGITNSLYKINGISVGVTAFPADARLNQMCATVCPMLKHGQSLHTNFCLRPSGSTPMGEAIWWAMAQCYPLTENRKIILIITDGKPDSVENTEKAIEHGKRLGFEFYGIGIENQNILGLLPGSSKVIHKLEELSPTMFSLLEAAMLKP
ncbi:MAG: VWA domain-containing protein [Victivallaceae bacterium]|nr:VWA domain-containing protein [Victivallaceae bacterium]